MHPHADPRRHLALRPRESRHACRDRRGLILVLAIFAAVFWLPTGWGIAAVAGGIAVEVGEAAFWIWLSKRRKSVVGAEALQGAVAVAVGDLRPNGQVRVLGELWQARCPEGADAGAEVVVERVEPDLTLLVVPK